MLNGLGWAVSKSELLDAAHGKPGRFSFKLNNVLMLYILIYDTIGLTVYILLVLN